LDTGWWDDSVDVFEQLHEAISGALLKLTIAEWPLGQPVVNRDQPLANLAERLIRSNCLRVLCCHHPAPVILS